MKRFNKMLAMALAFLVCLSVSTVALAEPTTEHLSVTNPVNGHTYTYYQLFVGDLAEDATTHQRTLSNVKWGNNVASSISYTVTKDGTTETKNLSPKPGDAVPQEVLDYVAQLPGKNATDAAQNTADIIGAWVQGDGATLSEGGANVLTGYYVIKDAYTDPTASQTTTLSTYLCEVVGPTAVEPKAGTTTSEKKVKDVNDSQATSNTNPTEWQDSADYDIGDEVPFQLTATIASDYAKYDTYKLTFHDHQSAGLTFNSRSVEVFVDGAKIDTGFTIVEPGKEAENPCTFEIVFTDLKTIESVKAGSKITVEYTSTLNKNAVIGDVGNPNESHIEFSNNPNNENETSNTPDDKVIVFTYETIFNKVDQDKKPLVGADFKLEKKVDGEWVDVTTLGAGENHPTKSGDTTVSTFEFKGLDDGDYRLTETVTPSGYNTIDPIEFTITANHEILSDNPTLTALTGTDGNQFNMTPNLQDGSLTSEVVNQKGSTLPSTGGMGTTLLYTIGGVLVAVSAVGLIARRKMSAEQ